MEKEEANVVTLSWSALPAQATDFHERKKEAQIESSDNTAAALCFEQPGLSSSTVTLPLSVAKSSSSSCNSSYVRNKKARLLEPESSHCKVAKQL